MCYVRHPWKHFRACIPFNFNFSLTKPSISKIFFHSSHQKHFNISIFWAPFMHECERILTSSIFLTEDKGEVIWVWDFILLPYYISWRMYATSALYQRHLTALIVTLITCIKTRSIIESLKQHDITSIAIYCVVKIGLFLVSSYRHRFNNRAARALSVEWHP